MSVSLTDVPRLRALRNTSLYRSLTRTLRVYNRTIVDRLRERGFTDFSPAFPPLLSNLDVMGTRIGVLAHRAGTTRQAAGQLIREIERCGYVTRRAAPDDARATVVMFTPRGRKLLQNIVDLAMDVEREFAKRLAAGEFDRVRDGLCRLADQIDPAGAFGAGDQAARRTRRAPR